VLITVASSRYNQQNRYVANWWLSLKDLPRFDSTIVKGIPIDNRNEVLDDEPYSCLYFVTNANKYVYWDGETFHNYEFKIIHNFQHVVTREWVEQDYVYSIQLVSGNDTFTYLKNLYKSVYATKDVPEDLVSAEQLVIEIGKSRPDLIANINYERPIVNLAVNIPLLPPTKLTVLSDPHGNFVNLIPEQNLVIEGDEL
jgi:hypothetical protein